MNKAEKCLMYILFILTGVSLLLMSHSLRRLEARIAALESREPVTASAVGVSRREALRLSETPDIPAERRTAVFTAYAYCACEKCCGKWAEYGLTASGTVPQQGRTVAVDPDVIPLGSELWIDGEGPFVAEDTGSGINGSTIDVYHDSHADALEWGKREVTVTWR